MVAVTWLVLGLALLVPLSFWFGTRVERERLRHLNQPKEGAGH